MSGTAIAATVIVAIGLLAWAWFSQNDDDFDDWDDDDYEDGSGFPPEH